MFDIVLPSDNELELIRMAEKLGWKELCLAYDKPADISRFRQMTSMRLISGIVAEPGKEHQFAGKADLLLSKTSDAGVVRTLCERGLVQIIFGLELSPRPDFMHHRNSGLNHVICEMMNEKGISISFDFSSILDSSGKQRATVLGRMRQNVVLARKYDIHLFVGSFARNPFGMRDRKQLEALLNILSIK